MSISSKNHLSEHTESLSNDAIADLAKQQLLSLKKVKRDNDKIQNELGKRTIGEIMSSGETFYMGACVDTTLSFLMKLKEKIPAQKLKIGCELLKQNETGNLTFHLFLIDESLQPQRVIDFVGSNLVHIYQGKYYNPQSGTKITHLTEFQVDAENIGEEDNFLSLAHKMRIPFDESAFQAYLGKLQRDNTDENFANFQVNAPIDIKIKRQNESIKNALFGALKKFGFLLLSLPLLQACNPKQNIESEQVASLPPVFSGTSPSIPEWKDDPNIPNCEPLDLKPIKPEDIINIDDVVQNCTYETGHIVYNPYEEKTKYLFQPIFIRKNTVTSNSIYDENPIICEYNGIPYRAIKNQDKWIEEIIINNNLQAKNLVDSVLPETDEDYETTFSTYKCKEKKLCEQLIGKAAGNNKKHYFLYGNNDFSKIGGLVIDDKIYNVGEKRYIKNKSQNTEILEGGPWIVDSLHLDTITLKKYSSGTLLEKYKNNPDLIYSEENEKKLENKKEVIIGTFQIKTCKIFL